MQIDWWHIINVDGLLLIPIHKFRRALVYIAADSNRWNEKKHQQWNNLDKSENSTRRNCKQSLQPSFIFQTKRIWIREFCFIFKTFHRTKTDTMYNIHATSDAKFQPGIYLSVCLNMCVSLFIVFFTCSLTSNREESFRAYICIYCSRSHGE